MIGGKRLYLLNDHGVLYGIDKHTGKVRWRRKLGALAAASPAYAGGVVYVVLLQRTRSGAGADAGRVVALDGKSGRIQLEPAAREPQRVLAARRRRARSTSARRTGPSTRWTPATAPCAGASRRAAPSRAGSRSPTAGSTSATTAAARTRSGRATAAWSGARRRAAAASGSARATSTPRPRSPTAACTWATRTGACTRSRRASGKLAWSHSTGGYVYGSPAVAAVPGGRPLVYIGSYSGRFYALDARSGAERWSRGGNGKISGGASVIGDIVYYADLGNKRTIGLDARSGRKVFEHERGSYNPVVSDGETIYLTGYHAHVRPRAAQRAGQAQAQGRRRRAGRAAAPRPAGVHAQGARGAPRQAALDPALDRALPGAQAGAPARGDPARVRRSGRARRTAGARAGSSAPTRTASRSAASQRRR